jgi:plasmid rolling circle replication initiator protein Rep
MKACRGKGLHVAMLTLTAPHYMGDNLKELLKNMGKAKHHYGQIETQEITSNRKCRNLYIATEVKYSDNNGFHPHYHILLILDKPYKAEDLEIIESDLYELWSEKCVKQGLGKPSRNMALT